MQGANVDTLRNQKAGMRWGASWRRKQGYGQVFLSQDVRPVDTVRQELSDRGRRE